MFYEIIANGQDGTPGDDGDVYYRCYHADKHSCHKICTIKKSIKNNYTGEVSFLRFVIFLTESSVLVSNLHVHIHTMFLLYNHLKDCDQTPTPDEIAIASGKRKLNVKEEAELIEKLKKLSENIKKAFQD